MGAKSGKSERSAGRQRLGLLLFGVLLVALFVIVAVAQGITQPSVPAGDAALVEEVPDGNVSEADLKRAVAQQIGQRVAAEELKKAPKAGSEKYEELQVAALTELVERRWLRGEAEELGISATKKQVENELDQIKEQRFPTPKAYREFLESSKYSTDDVYELVELQVLSTQIQERITNAAPPPSAQEVSDFYEAAKSTQFTTKPSRDVRIITNKSKAKVEAAAKELKADSSPASWKKAAKKYSEDPSTSESGGLQEGLSEEILPEPLKADIFGAATNELIGPIDFQGNFTIVEVVKLNPEKAQSLEEAEPQISAQLQQQSQEAFFNEFVAGYQSRWAARTFCSTSLADGVASAAQRDQLATHCANVGPSGRPAGAPPGCYEDNPEEGIPLECPAPVAQAAPALPGSATVLQPQGERLPQRPIPVQAAAPEEGSEALEELEGAPEGAAGE